MKIIDCEQNTPAWLQARLGIPTASEFARIITAAKGDLSKQARKYAHQLVAETLLGEPLDSGIGSLEWIVRGKLLEPQAVRQYEFTTDTETRAVGFITTDCGRLGCSPDRLIIGQRAGLEIKCCSPSVHVGYMVDGVGDEYRVQVQGQMLVADLTFVDLYAFHQQLPPVLVHTERDEPFIEKMRFALAQFCDMKDEMLEVARATGLFNRQMADAA